MLQSPPELRRLNRVEYQHTVQDLLGIDTPLADLLPEDASVQGFDNVAGGLGLEFTARMGELPAIHGLPWIYPEHVTWRHKEEPRPGVVIAWAETFGPLDRSFPSEAQQQLFGQPETITMTEGESVYIRNRRGVKSHYVSSAAPREDAERIIRNLVVRAFRRPVNRELADQFVQLTLDHLDKGNTFEQAVRAGVTAVLCSPHFLLINQETAVDDDALASRLSYFLWSSMPDDELLRLAADGKLSDPADYAQGSRRQ